MISYKEMEEASDIPVIPDIHFLSKADSWLFKWCDQFAISLNFCEWIIAKTKNDAFAVRKKDDQGKKKKNRAHLLRTATE